MKKILFFLIIGIGAADAAHLTGFYKTIDDKTNSPKSIVRLYECGDNICGRIVAIYDEAGTSISETIVAPVRVAEKVKGNPKMAGMDIIWDMKWDAKGNEYTGGKIMDPKSGSVYSSVIWQDKNEPGLLRVRGKVGPFGRTQVWHTVSSADLPQNLQKLDIKNWQVVVAK
ncbi:MAG: DUF2147 domain-containing protein [Alphaproteobacteria bacterium]|nr:DUF2147 domain-containing protein [Alphaproteobacteria bacterium]